MFSIDSPDTITAEGQSHHEGQSHQPSVRPARHLRALHRHIFVLSVVTPRDHSSFAAPKCMRRRKKEREKGENGDGKRDWVTGRLTEDSIVIATASSHGHDSQCRCPLPRPRRSLIPHGNPCPVTKAKKVGTYTCAISEKGRDVNHLLGLHTSRSLSSPIDHADVRDYLFAIINVISRINTSISDLRQNKSNHFRRDNKLAHIWIEH